MVSGPWPSAKSRRLPPKVFRSLPAGRRGIAARVRSYQPRLGPLSRPRDEVTRSVSLPLGDPLLDRETRCHRTLAAAGCWVLPLGQPPKIPVFEGREQSGGLSEAL